MSSLELEATAIAKQFEFTDDDVNKAVKEFLRQLGKRFT
jgi:hypothetical protein